MGKTNTQVVTKETTPWAEQIPKYSEIFGQAKNIYQTGAPGDNAYTPQYYPGKTVADFQPLQQQAYNQMTDYAQNAGRGIIGPAQSAYQNQLDQLNPMTNPYLDYSMSMAPGSAQTLSGMMQGGVNPYANEMVNAAMNRSAQNYQDLATQRARAYADEIMPQLGQAQGLTQNAIRQFTEGVAPQIRNTALSSGNYDSTRRGLAEGLAASRIGEQLTQQLGGIESQANLGAARTMQDLIQAGTRQGQSMSDMAAQMYGGAYEQGQNRALEAAQFGGSQLGSAYGQGIGATQNALGMAGQMYNLGLQPSQTLQDVGGIYQQMDQARIQDAINRYNYAQEAPWMQLNRYNQMIQGNYGGSASMPYYSNPYAGALGGAAAGYGAGGGWGALLGGLAGYYASQ